MPSSASTKSIAVLAWALTLSGCISSQTSEEVRVRTVRAQIVAFLTALDRYRADVGEYPSSSEGLQTLRATPPGMTRWRGPYLDKDVPTDAWGRPYIYVFPGNHGGQPDVFSYGRDGRPGGAGEDADITSWSVLEDLRRLK
jgi:general secretion pathway protein G